MTSQSPLLQSPNGHFASSQTLREMHHTRVDLPSVADGSSHVFGNDEDMVDAHQDDRLLHSAHVPGEHDARTGIPGAVVQPHDDNNVEDEEFIDEDPPLASPTDYSEMIHDLADKHHLKPDQVTDLERFSILDIHCKLICIMAHLYHIQNEAASRRAAAFDSTAENEDYTVIQ